MKQDNKIFIAIIIAALIIAITIYMSFNERNNPDKNPLLPNFTGEHVVTKVIDGNTIIVEGENVRLLGIDTDEKSYPCFNKAKERLEELILGKNVVLEKDKTDKDQYKRYLRYIFIDEKNINLQIVEEGLAIARFYPEDVKYKSEIVGAESKARNEKIGCKWGEIAQTKQNSIPTGNVVDEVKWTKLTKENTGLEVVGACNAGNYIGKEEIIEGKIVDAYKSKTNTIFLNFEKPYPNQCFNAIIFSSNLYKFPENPEDYYEGKSARVRGKIQEYEGKPEIVLNSMEQVEIG